MRCKSLLLCLLGLGLLTSAVWAEGSMPQVKGQHYDSKEPSSTTALQGSKGTVFAFFSVTCYPCRLEAPVLNELQKEFTAKGVKFHYLNLDEGPLQSRIPAFLKVTQINLPVFLPLVKEAYEGFLVTGLPYVLVFDAKGKEVYRHAGFDPELKENLRETLKHLNL